MDEQTSQPHPAIGGTRKHMGVATSDPTSVSYTHLTLPTICSV